MPAPFRGRRLRLRQRKAQKIDALIRTGVAAVECFIPHLVRSPADDSERVSQIAQLDELLNRRRPIEDHRSRFRHIVDHGWNRSPASTPLELADERAIECSLT